MPPNIVHIDASFCRVHSCYLLVQFFKYDTPMSSFLPGKKRNKCQAYSLWTNQAITNAATALITNRIVGARNLRLLPFVVFKVPQYFHEVRQVIKRWKLRDIGLDLAGPRSLVRY